MKCRCGSEKVVRVRQIYGVNEYLCTECKKYFKKEIDFDAMYYTSTAKKDEDFLRYICGCMEQNTHTIYNNTGNPVKINL